MREKIFNYIAYLVLVLGLLLTFLLWQSSERNIKQKRDESFQDLAIKTEQRLLSRVQTYLDAHFAGAGLFLATEEVTKEQWRTFVNVLNLTSSYPGINGIGYAAPVTKTDSSQFILQTRRDVDPQFKLRSLGKVPQASDMFVIKYIEPLDRNLPAIGLDMGSEPIRRQAMERARDSKMPAISSKVVLVQDATSSPGFLMYVPVFNKDPETGLKTNFKGWVYSPFIAKNFVEGVLRYELSEASQYFNIELYDGTEPDTANLLYASWQPEPSDNPLSFLNHMPVLGNTWTVKITATDKFHRLHSHTQSWVILVAGILLSLLLFFLLHNLAKTRKKALALAETMTLEYRKLNQELDQKVHERTSELAEKNKKLNLYTEHLKNAYEDLETKVKFRSMDLEKQIKKLKAENEALKGNQQ